ncbi:MAG: cache domain-containing protein [Zoogloeaceae bacterium]|jgi:methyl-accepting chemotaxis protein|nr:cache domain-containing protein [Zoogloeaceae bacterium]
MSLQQRLFAFVVIFLIVVIVGMSGGMYRKMHTEIVSGVRQEVRAVINGNRIALMYWVAQRRAAIEAIAERLALANDPVPFLIVGKNAGRFDQTFVGYEDKRIIYHLADKKPPAGYNPTVRPWYIEAEKTRNTIVSQPYICTSTQQPCITIARSVFAKTPSVVGGDISLAEITLLVNSIQLHNDGYAFLVTRDGKIVAHPQPDSALKPVEEVIPGFNAEILITADANATPHEFVSEGIPKYMVAASIPGTDWVLCLVVDRAMVLSPLRYLLGGLLLAGLIVAFLGMPIARSKTQPQG